MSIASQQDLANAADLRNQAFKGYDLLSGGDVTETAKSAALEGVGSGLQDTGSGLTGGAAAIGIAKGVSKLRKTFGAAKKPPAEEGGGAGGDAGGAAGDAGGDAATDAALGLGDDAGDVLPALADAGGGAADVAAGAAGGAADAAAGAAGGASEFIAAGASAEEVLAGTGIGETPIGLGVAAALGIAMSIAGFFVHKHAKKETTTTPIVSTQAAPQNYFDQSGAGNVA